MAVRNPDLSDMTQREGQHYKAVFNGGTQGAEHKEMCRSTAGYELGEKGMAPL